LNTRSIWWSRRFRLGWILIAIATVNALGWTLVRWSYENSMRRVQLTVDYDDTRSMADAYQIPHAQLLNELKKRGISSVGLYDFALANYRDNGRIAITPREEAMRLYPNVAWASYPPAYRYLITASPENQSLLRQFEPRLREQSQPSLPPKVVLLGAPEPLSPGIPPINEKEYGNPSQFGILIPASRQLISDAIVGYDPAQVRAVKSAGMKVTARISNTLNLNPQRVETLLNDAAATGARVVIFSEDEVLGYDSLYKDVARQMKARGLIFGNIEFTKQRGWQDFAKNTDGLVVRVHSIGGDEAAKAKTELMVDRFARAVKERDIRVAYIRLLRQYKGELPEAATTANATSATNVTLTKTALQQNLEFIEEITRELRTQSVPAFLRPTMEMGGASAFGDYPNAWVAERTGAGKGDAAVHRASLIVMLGRFLSGLGAVGAVLLMLNLFFDLSRRAQITWLLLGLIIVAGLSLSAGMGAKLMALVVGVSFSAIGMFWGGLPRVWDTLTEQQELGLSRREPSVWLVFCQGAGVLVRTTLITGLGALIIVSLLNSWKFMSKTDEFLGEKATLLAPLLLIAFAFTGEVFPHRVVQDGATAARWRARQRFMGVLSQPFTVRTAVTIFALLVAGFIFIARTGNDSGMEVSSFEWNMRALLERLFLTRPRTKEIFLGMPAMIFVVWFARQGRWWPAYLAAIAATIGQADVINTFCHIHTPIFYSLLRTIHGVWLGAIVGGVALWLYRAVELKIVGRMRAVTLPPRPPVEDDGSDGEARFENGSTIGRVFIPGRTDATR
jgi:hypothetical protein